MVGWSKAGAQFQHSIQHGRGCYQVDLDTRYVFLECKSCQIPQSNKGEHENQNPRRWKSVFQHEVRLSSGLKQVSQEGYWFLNISMLKLFFPVLNAGLPLRLSVIWIFACIQWIFKFVHWPLKAVSTIFQSLTTRMTSSVAFNEFWYSQEKWLQLRTRLLNRCWYTNC